MTTAQRVIKYLGIAFAISLIVSIAGGIIFGVSVISGITGDKKNSAVTEQMQPFEVTGSIESLDINIISVDLTVKTGDVFGVETNNGNIKCRQDNNTLYIEENHHSWFFGTENGEIVITVPVSMTFENVNIESGAGVIRMDALATQNLDFDLGAGDTKIDSLTVLRSADIDGGAGKTVISGGTVTDLDFDIGVGQADITAAILGESKLSCGVGETRLTLSGSQEDYRIILDKGLGSATIGGEQMNGDVYYGNGKNDIAMESGIGSVIIKFDNTADTGDGISF